ncbi:ABC transporter substrate-binding protein [Falsiroseomonas sp.]|uniref:ABC transporter substrate-binding protein n=1 Tax=Falsiroseomonas sp. TaxID=2870721 RepID=UPI003F6FED14
MAEAPFTLAIGRGPMGDALRQAGALPDGTPVTLPEIEPIHRAFAPMAMQQRFDVAEMAIVTALQAIAFGKPIILLPITLAARFQHRCIIRLACRPELTPGTLAGRRIGVRAYTQTTGMWVRAILAEAAGLQAADSQWLTQDPAHVAEFADPPFVTHVAPGLKLPAMLRDGLIDAAILGNDLPEDADFAPVFPDPDAAARAWFDRTGVVPINHALVASRAFAEARPGTLAALLTALRAARPRRDPDLLPDSAATMAHSLAHVLAASEAQGLLPRRMTVEEIFAPARALGLH